MTCAGALDVEWRHRDGTFLPHYRVEIGGATLGRLRRRSANGPARRPESGFTRMWQCARALEGGWATLDGHHLRVTGIADPVDQILTADDDLAEALDRWFGIDRERSTGRG